ncbi:MAG: response regulator [Candidatus Marinimicrobia bacterium]|nr:response regulator [Candidatus Neomarinimicrobiota bacterium]
MENTKSPTILVVEDDSSNIVYLTYMLKRLNIDYQSVYSGPEALNVIESINPTLMLIDISLTEEMSGIDLMKELNANDAFMNIPKIAMSAHITAETKDDYIGSGFTDCLKKPYTLDDLTYIINKYS